MKRLALALAACLPAVLSAQAPQPSARVDAGAVVRFADAFFPAEMARRRIPGLVLSVVADGTLVAARGYGAAQLEPWRAVDPQHTVFRVASVCRKL